MMNAAFPPRCLVALAVLAGLMGVAATTACKPKDRGGDGDGGGEVTEDSGTGDETGTSTADDDEETAVPPHELTGIYLVNFEEARARCDSKAVAGGYEIECAVVAQLASGAEVAVGGIADGTTFAWGKPKTVGGDAVGATCTARGDGLLLHCEVPAAKVPDDPALLFTLAVQAEDGSKRAEKALVLLSYSVGVTAGLTPFIPVRYATAAPRTLALAGGAAANDAPDAPDADQYRHGYQSQAIAASAFPLSEAVPNLCVHGEEIFFENKGAILRLADGKVTYYAGVPYSYMAQDTSLDLQGTDHSHARRYNLGWLFKLACGADGSLAIQRGSFGNGPYSEIVRFDPAGFVAPLAGRADHGVAPANGLDAADTRLDENPWWLAMAAGDVWFMDTIDGGFWRIKPDGTLRAAFTSEQEWVAYAGNSDFPAIAADESAWISTVSQADELADPTDVLQRVDRAGNIEEVVLSDAKHPLKNWSSPMVRLGADGSIWVLGKDFDDASRLLAVRVGADRKVSHHAMVLAPALTAKDSVEIAADVDAQGRLVLATWYTVWPSPFASDVRIVQLAADGTMTTLLGAAPAPTPCDAVIDARDRVLPSSAGVAVLAGDADDVVLAFDDVRGSGAFRLDVAADGTPRMRAIPASKTDCTAPAWARPLSVHRRSNATHLLRADFHSDGPYPWGDGTLTLEEIDLEDGSTRRVAGGGAKVPSASVDMQPATDYEFRSSATSAGFGFDFWEGMTYLLAGGRVYEVDAQGRMSFVTRAAPLVDPSLFTTAGFAVASADSFFYSTGKDVWLARRGATPERLAGGGTAKSWAAARPASEVEIGRVINLEAAPDGSVYLFDFDRNVLSRIFQREADGPWWIETVFGGRAAADCGTGLARGEALADEVGARLAASAATLCAGTIRSYDVHGSCAAAGGGTTAAGTYRVLIGQDIGGYGNVVELRVPCRPPRP
jgi:hypothetical protein